MHVCLCVGLYARLFVCRFVCTLFACGFFCVGPVFVGFLYVIIVCMWVCMQVVSV